MNDKEWERRRYEKSKPAYDALMKVYPFDLEDLDGELWQDFNGYHVSSFGRVKSFKSKTPRIIKPAFADGGYLRICLSQDNKKNNFLIHRLVAQLFIPNPENKPQVNHIDGNKLNNFVGNLEWATSSENQQHAFIAGLQVQSQGEDSPLANFTNEQIQYVRNNPDGLKGYELAEMFGVSQTTISKIQLCKRYKIAGGSVRQSKRPRVPSNLRQQIQSEYVFGSRDFNARALARKYGVSHRTILKIVKEI